MSLVNVAYLAPKQQLVLSWALKRVFTETFAVDQNDLQGAI
jgi:hypothetical protein